MNQGAGKAIRLLLLSREKEKQISKVILYLSKIKKKSKVILQNNAKCRKLSWSLSEHYVGLCY